MRSSVSVGVHAPVASRAQGRREGLRGHLRGSSLLLFGRLASLAINLAVQVLTVRYLARDEYGTFAWALAVIAGATQFVLLGLDTTVARFVATHHERGDGARALGAIALCAGVITVTSLALGLGTFAASGSLPELLGAEPAALSLLLVMLVMAPLQALDGVLNALYGVFGQATSIMVRRYLVGPGLKLASVLAVICVGGDVFDLAFAYVASLVAGVGVYALLLVRLLRRDPWLASRGAKPLVVPAREMFGFTASLLTAELVFLFYGSFIAMILQYSHGAGEVAGFQAARPFAKLIDVALGTVQQLFVPALARFHARSDREGIEQLYGQTCAWIALLSFPLFALVFAMADSLVVPLLGAGYADAGDLLAWMSLGFFVHGVLGVNPHTLRVLGFVRTAVAVDLLALVAAVAISMTLIPSRGASGAAATLTLVLGVRGALYLAALRWRSGLQPLRGHASIHAAVALAVLALAAARPLYAASPLASGLTAAATIVAVLTHARRRVALTETFPELARIPLLARLCG
jgi:O-antigen/teichoic acid export membrane protein